MSVLVWQIFTEHYCALSLNSFLSSKYPNKLTGVLTNLFKLCIQLILPLLLRLTATSHASSPWLWELQSSRSRLKDKDLINGAYWLLLAHIYYSVLLYVWLWTTAVWCMEVSFKTSVLSAPAMEILSLTCWSIFNSTHHRCVLKVCRTVSGGTSCYSEVSFTVRH